jgi:internalin A
MTRDELLELIDQAAAEGWTELDLSGQNLTELPPEIGQLTQLETLILGKPEENFEVVGNRVLQKVNTNALTSLPVEISNLHQLQTLDLSGNPLKELPEWLPTLPKLTKLAAIRLDLAVIPDSLAQLPNLQQLYLRSNQISTIPDSLAQLPNLQQLDLSSNQISTIPDSLAQLPNLQQLDLRSNQISTIPDSLAQLPNLQQLDLRSNQISTIPDSLAQLPNLQQLDLRSNQISTIPDSLAQLPNLQQLYLRSNQISTIPDSLAQLPNLQQLYLRSNQISTIPDSLAQLPNLQQLNLSSNQISTIPDSLAQLPNLQQLYLRSNQISTIPDSLAQLPNLQQLDLSSNQISTIPDSLAQLPNLQQLDLSSNQISTIPDSLAQLPNLQQLYLRSNQISTIPDSLAQLPNLQQLYLRSNQISTIPDSLAQLPNLQQLDLSSNQISTIPDSLAQLPNLQQLNLSSNQISTIPDSLAQLPNLQQLYLRSNQISTIPDSLAQLPQLEKLDLRGNPIPVPPELLGPKESWQDPGDIHVIFDYYFQTLDPAETTPLYEAKFIIVGEGGAGKTTLAKKLLDADYDLDDDEKSTEGIDVLPWEFDHPNSSQFRANIWDFGGQEIYHATHQFFLTKRSLYALVVDTRKENTDLDHWLNIVSLLSDNSPVFLIKNEKQDRQCQVSERDLQREFPNVEAVYATNLADNRGLEAIAAAIQQRITRLPHVGTPLPKLWVRVRAALENYAAHRNTLTLGEYHDLCRINQLTDPDRIATLSRYLHDLGVILHFHDDPILKHTVILKPDWGTAAVYKALDTPDVQTNCGRFTRAQLDTIWAESDTAVLRDELLQLMMRFKLCYEIPGRPQHYIAPQLLEPNAPTYDWDDSRNLILRYRYDFLPKGILTRLIVELHEFIEAQTLVWKTGVVFTNGSDRAEVTEHRGKRELRLRVSGSDPKRWLSAVTHEINKIHASYQSSDNPRDTRLRYQTLIPCNCNTCKGSQTPHTFPYDTLQQFLRDGQYQIQCQARGYAMVDVRRLLDDVLFYRDPGPGSKWAEEIQSSLFSSDQPVPDTNPLLANAQKQYWSEDNLLDKVFLSYGWGDDNQPVIATIEQICAAQNIPLVRDTQYLKFQDSAQRFMETLGQSKAIILVIGDAYLKSENCMFELVEIATHGDFHQRVFPIILPSAQTLYDAVERLDYIEHWEQKFTALDQKMKRVRAAKLGNIQETANLYDRIRQNFDQLIGVITDMITVDLKTLDSLDSNPQFTQLLQQLQARLTR